jgi:hypothetical protein
MDLKPALLLGLFTGCAPPHHAATPKIDAGIRDSAVDRDPVLEIADLYSPPVDLARTVHCEMMNAGEAGQVWGAITSGDMYTYTAKGCIAYTGSNDHYSLADGETFSGSDCMSGPLPSIMGNDTFKCPNARPYSLVAGVTDAFNNMVASCIQLSTAGDFLAPATGLLHLYYNDNNYSDNTSAWNVCFYGLEREPPNDGPPIF